VYHHNSEDKDGIEGIEAFYIACNKEVQDSFELEEGDGNSLLGHHRISLIQFMPHDVTVTA